MLIFFALLYKGVMVGYDKLLFHECYIIIIIIILMYFILLFLYFISIPIYSFNPTFPVQPPPSFGAICILFAC